MPSDLWMFANTFYRHPGVERACLELQAHGGDVCLAICALWLERNGVALEAQRVACLQKAAAPWQREVVARLRQVRQQWRQPAQHDGLLAELREHVKALELEAERILLTRLQRLCEHWPTSTQPRPHWLEAMEPAATAALGHAALSQLRAAASWPAQDAEGVLPLALEGDAGAGVGATDDAAGATG